MSSLDPFERAKVSLSPGQALRVTASGLTNVQVLEGGPTGTTPLTNEWRDFGPYSVNARLLVECVSGQATYGYANALAELSQDQVLAVESEGAIAAPSVPWRAAQDAINFGACIITRDVGLAQPLLLGSRTRLSVRAGVTVTGTGANQHNFARVGNAEYLDNGIPGIWIVCATQRSSYGEGTIAYTHSGTTLTYTAPGDTAGAPVSIAAVVSVATSNIFTLTSGNGVDQLHVVVASSASRTGNSTKSLRIEPITGARPITWVRNGSTFVATEAGHTRRIGDIVMVFGAARQHGYIIAADATTWTLADTAGAGSGSGQAFGVRSPRISAAGARIVGNHSTLPNTNVSNHNHCLVIFAATSPRIELGDVEDFTKYVVYATGCADLETSGVTAMSGDCADTIHYTGPQRNPRAFNVRAKAIDNVVGIGCCDYIDYNIFFPSNGTVDVEDPRVSIECVDTIFEPVRFYNANSGWIRRAVVEGVRGTYDSATGPCAVRVMTDNNASQVDPGNTNIDGLTLRRVTAVADSASVHTPALISTGTGTRRGLKIEDTPLRGCGSNLSGTVVIDSAWEDVEFTPEDGASGWSGAAMHVRGAGTIRNLTINVPRRLRGDNQLGVDTGTAQQPCLLQLESAAATVTKLTMNGGVIDDISSTGTKAAFVRNNGVVSKAYLNNIEAIDCEAVWRQLTNSNSATRVYVNGAQVDATYFFVTDVAIAAVQAVNVHQSAGTFAHLGAAGTYRFDLCNVNVVSRLIRNVTGASTITVNGVNVNAGTFFQNDASNPTLSLSAANCSATTPFSIGGGTPDIRLTGPVSLPIDGTIINATATNHAANASFYNSGAGFGAGVGGYVRGASAWVRIAA